MLFFGLVYFAQGVAGGLSKQPLTYYFKSLGLTADAVAALLAVAATPWMIKPLYGLMTDFVPLFGYRRKSYLLLMAGLAAIGYLALSRLLSAELIVWALVVSTLGIAAIDVVVDALMVEQGLKLGLIKQFQGQQWTWLNLAAVATALVGGWLSQAFTPEAAIRTAALIMLGAPAAILVATWIFVDERPLPIEAAGRRRAARALVPALRSPALWRVAGFLAFWSLIPNFGTPIYYHMVDHLQFDQYLIGQLVAIGSVGATIGAWVFRRYFAERFSTAQLLTLSITLSVMMALGYLFMKDAASAVLLYFSAGIVSMIALLTLFSLAAAVCPPHAAGFTFAALMAVYSLTAQVSAMLGGHLYERVFDHQIAPLIYLAAAVTLAAFLWIPFLPAEPASSSDLEAEKAYAA
jgi:MFS family permease